MPNISSSSVLENGWPVLVVDVEDLIRSIDNLLSGRRLGKLTAQKTEQEVAHRSECLSLTIRSRCVSWKGSCWRTVVILLMSQLMELTAGTQSVCARYDLVVSDIDMPRMDGIQLVQHIKGDARLKMIPVVIVSYKDREEDRIRGLDAGANFYLTKSSFHDQTFLTTVADLIGGPRQGVT